MLTFIGKVGDRKLIASVEADGWSLRVRSVVTKLGLRYDAELWSPDGRATYTLLLARDLDHVHESVQTFLQGTGLRHVARALRAKVGTAVRP